jgi:hypothetical protein
VDGSGNREDLEAFELLNNYARNAGVNPLRLRAT